MVLLGGSAGMQTQVSPQRHAPSPLGGTVCAWFSWRWHSVGHGGAAAGWARCPAQVAGSHTDGHLHHHGPLSGVTLRKSGLPLRPPPKGLAVCWCHSCPASQFPHLRVTAVGCADAGKGSGVGSGCACAPPRVTSGGRASCWRCVCRPGLSPWAEP